jgi:DNA mismatch repair protein MutS2
VTVVRKNKIKRNNPRHSFHYDMEIDLHGKFVDEAIMMIEEIIFASDSSSILIVHGRGDGILRRAVRDFLKNNKNVKDIKYGELNNIPGADGVTVIYT